MIFSGRHGNVQKTLYTGEPPVAAKSAVSAVMNWVLSEITNPHQYVHSALKAGNDRNGGTYDFNGSFEAMGKVPEIMPGQFFDFHGYTAPTAIATNGVGKVVETALRNTDPDHPLYNWPGAICDSVEMNWDFENGRILNHSISFSQSNGLELNVQQAFQEDDTDFEGQSVCPLCLEYKSRNDGDTAFERREWPLVSNVSVTITSNNQSFVNSSTNCGTGRYPGAVDVTASITVDSSETPPIIYQGEAERNIKVRDRLVLYIWTAAKPVTPVPLTDGGDFWIFDGLRVTEIVDFRVDPESQEIVGFTVNLGMAAIDDSQPTDNLGFIARPGEMKDNQPSFGEPWWPNVYNQNAYTPS